MFDKLVLEKDGIRVNGVAFKYKKGFSYVDKIKELKTHKLQLIRNYNEYIERMKNMEHVPDVDFTSLVNKIHTVDNNLLNVFEEYEIQNKQRIEQISFLKEEVDRIQKQIYDIEQKQIHNTRKEDIKLLVSLKKQITQYHIDIRNLTNEVSDYIHEHNSNDTSIIEDIGYILHQDKKTKPKKAKEPPTKQPANEPPTKQPVKEKKKKIIILDSEKQKQLRTQAKDVLKTAFKFTNKQDCLSRKQAVFMSKDQIVQTIDKHQELKEIVPKNYKSLSKEELCTYLFEEKN